MNEINWVDLVIIALLISSAVHGFLQGAAVQVFSYVGFIVGLLVGAKLGPVVGQMVQNPALRIAVVITTLFATASLLGTVGRFIGAKATWAVPKASPLGVMNSVGGLGVAVLITLLTTWLVGGMLAQVPLGGVTEGLQSSRVMRGLTDRLPPAPSVFTTIQRTLLPSGFPPVFAELEPSLAPEVPVTGNPDLQAIVSAVRPSVVKVSGPACNQISSGSGFVAAPNLVITNAHVVAGTERPNVLDARGSHRATVVYFDPEMDLAVLRTSGLAGRPLALRGQASPRGQQGGVLGFPGGGPFTAQPGVVRDLFRDAVGRDIYSDKLVTRNVYQVDAEVHPGNSGGPFVAPGGEVIGVVFASSVVRPEIAYVLNSVDVAARLDRVRGATAAVDTGPCIR
ncbi:MAG TPA: MarP family serine protease [Actinomycetota bacterium]|nr:MarP family serine protease [Actinomycetota bacterium]